MAMRFVVLCFLIVLTGKICAQSVASDNEKAIKAYKIADKAMARAYAKALKSSMEYGAALQKQLKATQKAFLIYRQNEAAFYDVKFRNASMQPLFKYRALKRLTDARIRQLNTSSEIQ